MIDHSLAARHVLAVARDAPMDKMPMNRRTANILIVAAAAGLVGAVSYAQATNSAGRDWASPLGDPGGSRFSTLTQINTSNVTQLKRAWTFKTGSGRFANSPMVVDSVMYFSAPNGVYALDAVTGTQIWKYVPPQPPAPPAPPPAAAPAPAPGSEDAPADGRGAAPGAAPGGRGAAAPGGGGRGGGRGGGGVNAGTALRGPTYWAGSNGVAPRIYSTVTQGLAALDAKTGTLVTSFGENGVIPGLRPDSPGVIYRNALVVQGGSEPGKGETIKAFDIVTGKPMWTFYLKAQPGDPNREKTWLNGSADSAASPGMWGMLTVDPGRGIVYVPVDKPGGNGNNDYWGGGSHGNNLYANSLIAIDALTGRMKWYQQLVHHDIWDYDLAAAPTLFDVRRNGQVIPAVAQQNKMGLLFIFNRETGEPIFGMEERPVPQTTAPGEWTSPTQPFPIKPAPLVRNSITRAELSKVTPEHQAFCEGLWDKYKLSDSGPYTPWKVGQDIVVFPGAQGGGNWHGSAFNPPLGLIIQNVMTAGQWGQLVPPGAGGGRGGGGGGAAAPAPAAPAPGAPAAAAPAAPAQGGGGRGGGGALAPGTPAPMNKRTPEQGRFWQASKRWSCSEPPWGELIAVNANTGDIAWRVPFGEFEELTALGVPKTGAPSSGAAITTAGNLVFIGASIDGYFRAFDARDGKELWKDKLTVPNQGTPTTYLGRDGKQYVVIGANGGGYFGAPSGDEVIAYALP